MTPPVGRQTRRLVDTVTDLLSRLDAAVAAYDKARDQVVHQFGIVRDALVTRELRRLPLDDLRQASEQRLLLSPLTAAGYDRVGDILGMSTDDLNRIPGVGDASARTIRGALDGFVRAATADVRFRIKLDPTDAASTRLLQSLRTYRQLLRVRDPLQQEARRLRTGLPRALADALPATSRLRWWFAGDAAKAQAAQATAWLDDVLRSTSVFDQLGQAERAVAGEGGDVWPEFEAAASDWYAWLSEVVPLGSEGAARGFLSDDLVARVEAVELDDRLRTVTLRGYQVFGAQFAIAQERVILGDEMGLGKTIQALAVLAHLTSQAFPGPRPPYLVVCPATLMSNWERETRARTQLDAVVIHGADRQDEVTAWLRGGDVGITTYETLRRLELPHDLALGALVVDEAHYVKNAATLRAKTVTALVRRTQRVLFLTGTPMENRVEEFEVLAGLLRPGLIAPGTSRGLGATGFRKAVAPVYLRRRTEDVLVELPDREEIDEWVDFTRQDRLAYVAAVHDGNFMAMRRAGFQTFDPQTCGKADRLTELVEEAAANERKVVVFSFFREVVDGLSGRLSTARGIPPVFGPISGAVGVSRRTEVLDAFTACRGPAVLVAQIQAGGIGLNIQAASVVIFCEPQLTPTVEEQAIARVHRMGQVRSVQVHRLLNPDTVEERIRWLNQGKSREFDLFAARSYVAEATESAVDVTYEALATRLVREERERLALEPAT